MASSRRAHHQLVLGVDQRLGRRGHVDALGDQLVEQLGRHVLVVEGERAAAPSAARRSASRSVCEPITTSGVTCAAGSSGVTASTRSVWPSAIADWCVILASCPPPIMVTLGVGHSVHGVMACAAVTCTGARRAHCFRTLACRVLHRRHDRAAAPPDPAVLRTAPRAHQVRHRRRDDVRHRLGGVLHAEADGAGAQAGHGEDHRRHRRGDRLLHPEQGVELPESRRPRAPPRGAAVLRLQRGRRAAVAWRRCGSPATCCSCASPTCR